MNWNQWSRKFEHFLTAQMDGDAAHGLSHVRRVVANARRLADLEEAETAVVLPAAWLHDCVTVPKDSPDRSCASQMAAETAVAFLRAQNYPAQHLDAIAHAIAAHSFSANIQPRTIAAQVVQDADRLEALGAIGIYRCFATGVAMERPFYHPPDPFCRHREPDDALATLDHFYTKLLKLAATMQTAAGRQEAERRTTFMRAYLDQLAAEIG